MYISSILWHSRILLYIGKHIDYTTLFEEGDDENKMQNTDEIIYYIFVY